MKKYAVGICGGTFDYLHEGHKRLLEHSLFCSSKFIIGLTSNVYARKYKIDAQDFKVRKRALLDFLAKKKNVKIISIDDIYGPTLAKNFKADCIFVSEETKKGADSVNKKRKKHGFKPLKIEVIPLVKDQKNLPISSTAIREGIIDRLGNYYVRDDWFVHSRQITEALRKELKKPFGKFIRVFETWYTKAKLDPLKTITVGDIITDSFNKKKFGQKISVVDLLVQRKLAFETLGHHKFLGGEKILQVKNPPGTLTPQLFKTVKIVFNKNDSQRFIIHIIGEEDLVVLPLILLAPLGFTIFYGQPQKGAVQITVTESTKQQAHEIVNRFVTRKQG